MLRQVKIHDIIPSSGVTFTPGDKPAQWTAHGHTFCGDARKVRSCVHQNSKIRHTAQWQWQRNGDMDMAPYHTTNIQLTITAHKDAGSNEVKGPPQQEQEEGADEITAANASRNNLSCCRCKCKGIHRSC